MTGPPRRLRRRVRSRVRCAALRLATAGVLLTMAGALFATAGCDGGGAPPAAQRQPVRIALAERLDAADVGPSAEHLDFLGADARALLRAGWHEPSALDGERRRWSRQRAASLDVPVVAPAPLDVELDLTPVQALLLHPDHAEPARLRVLWNGEAVADEALEPARALLALRVPPERQRTGLNQLDLLPSHWLAPRVHRLSWDRRMLGFRLDGLTLRSDAPQRLPASPGVRRDGATLVQRAGSVATFGVRLPQAARLEGRLALRGDPGGAGRALLTLTDEDGSDHVLLDHPLSALAAPAGVPADADLGRFAGRFVALNLACSLPAGGDAPPAPELEWRELQIAGERIVAALPPSRIPRDRYNLIVLLPDSLRADHLDLEDGEATPHARRLFDRGVHFANMRSNSSWTRPAVASMFTSLGPVSHGIHGMADSLDATLAYLPQLLNERGYRTIAVLNSPVVSPSYRFGRGYDKTYTYYGVREERRAAPDFGPRSEIDHVWREFVKPQLARAGDRPFFLFLHEIDPHSPYEPPEPYASRHATGLRASFNLARSAAADPNHYDPGAIAHLRSLYRGEVAAMDDYLGRLLEILEETGLAANTVVVVISDHGEEFLDHRGVGHGKTVWEEQLRVPFLMSLPGVLPQGVRPTVAAQTLDVAPTLLDLLGIEIPSAMQGRSLLPWLEGAAPEALDRPLLAHAMNRRVESLQRGRWKLVRRNPDDPALGAPSYGLFDLERDPGEVTDLWQAQPVIGIALRQELEREIARQAAATGRRPEPAPREIPPEMVEALKALGYGGDDAPGPHGAGAGRD